MRDLFSKGAYPSLAARYVARAKAGSRWCWRFARANWIGTVLILLATLVFFWPIATRLNSYSESGDAQFNAWTLSRDHHCIMRENCKNYSDGNIYFPHKDTMLYSETQLSTGLLTLPIYWITKNPLVPYNVATISGFFFAAWFMYLLAKRLSRRNELISTMAGLIFAFAPYKMAGISHLQNLSILWLPLIVLFILKYLEAHKKRYLLGLFLSSAILFSASWYQLVFVAIAIAIIFFGVLVFRIANWKVLAALVATVGLAGLTTLPVAKEYMRFSKESRANFSIADQVYYASDVTDYFIPHAGTILGKWYYNMNPEAKVNSYNPDSYSYHGVTLYVVGLSVLMASFVWWRRHRKDTNDLKWVIIFSAIGITGLVLSLGPLFKVMGNYAFGGATDGVKLAVPLPFLLIIKILPQLSFIRAIGRISVLFLFALCCLLALLPAYLAKFKARRRTVFAVLGAVCVFAVIELAPIHRVPMANPGTSYAYNITVPPVYEFVRTHKEIDNLIILHSDYDYPDAFLPGVVIRNEEVMWAGYHNKNIFNGYSGYTPPTYFQEWTDYINFNADDVPKLKKQGLRYVIVDKQLSKSRPELLDDVARVLHTKVYEDQRYAMFKVE